MAARQIERRPETRFACCWDVKQPTKELCPTVASKARFGKGSRAASFSQGSYAALREAGVTFPTFASFYGTRASHWGVAAVAEGTDGVRVTV